MDILTWTSDLDTGIDWVDTQHRQIVQYINDLNAAQATGRREQVGVVMENLVRYTLFHFAEEERMLERAGYPLTEIHKGVHQRFTERLHDIHARFKAGQDSVTALLALLENWLFSHIRVNDRGYVAAVRKAGADHRA